MFDQKLFAFFLVWFVICQIFVTNVNAGGSPKKSGKPPRPPKTFGQILAEPSSFRKPNPPDVDKDGWPLGLPAVSQIVRNSKSGPQNELADEFGTPRSRLSSLSGSDASFQSAFSTPTSRNDEFESGRTHLSSVPSFGSTQSYFSAQEE
ncbi:uncharacterized protein LOC116342000 [Contarinia nasturtii]|uniref:uncharacterized protein LOC116342000 n=1 Tax=Contarinia nasturtii TaxID=265458 RepID=UPI0012D405A3|nr:uncharacterized protein LOC116342000 [Contarinia nasturtii]